MELNKFPLLIILFIIVSNLGISRGTRWRRESDTSGDDPPSSTEVPNDGNNSKSIGSKNVQTGVDTAVFVLNPGKNAPVASVDIRNVTVVGTTILSDGSSGASVTVPPFKPANVNSQSKVKKKDPPPKPVRPQGRAFFGAKNDSAKSVNTKTPDNVGFPTMDNGRIPSKDNGRIPSKDNVGFPPIDNVGFPPKDNGNGKVPPKDNGNGRVPPKDNGRVPPKDIGKVPSKDNGNPGMKQSSSNNSKFSIQSPSDLGSGYMNK